MTTKKFFFFFFFFFLHSECTLQCFFRADYSKSLTGQQVVIKNNGDHYILDTCFGDK